MAKLVSALLGALMLTACGGGGGTAAVPVAAATPGTFASTGSNLPLISYSTSGSTLQFAGPVPVYQIIDRNNLSVGSEPNANLPGDSPRVGTTSSAVQTGTTYAINNATTIVCGLGWSTVSPNAVTYLWCEGNPFG
jgi:hypothetical protein